jgi:hypothetical protein
MADASNPSEGDQPKQPFVAQGDRPHVGIDPDTPLSELRVRDLAALLGSRETKSPFEVGKTPLKEFFDKPFPEVAKDPIKEIKGEQVEKPPKTEKNEKLEKNEKAEKIEKREKNEVKEIKVEKLELDGVFTPANPVGPDPRLEQVIEAVTALRNQVGQLADQVAELRDRS